MRNSIILVVLAISFLFLKSCKKEVDDTAPIINLKGDNPMFIEKGDVYNEPGADVVDDYDEDLINNLSISGSVNTSEIGTYIIRYNVQDNSGNQADEKTREVIVTKPELISPNSDQNGFAINYTATWCGFCGDWGGPKINKFANDAPKGAVITAHTSGDPMYNQNLYSSFSSDRETGGGIPSFWVADTKTSSDNAMTSFLSSNPTAIAGVNYEYTISDNIMNIKTKTKFFSAASGGFNLSVLVLEDGIDGSSSAGSYTQNGTTNSYPNDDYEHNYVLRASATPNAYGELIAQDPDVDSEFDKEFTITLDASWNNPYPVCIIWNVDPAGSPQYKFINSLKKKN